MRPVVLRQSDYHQVGRHQGVTSKQPTKHRATLATENYPAPSVRGVKSEKRSPSMPSFKYPLVEPQGVART